MHFNVEVVFSGVQFDFIFHNEQKIIFIFNLRDMLIIFFIEWNNKFEFIFKYLYSRKTIRLFDLKRSRNFMRKTIKYIEIANYFCRWVDCMHSNYIEKVLYSRVCCRVNYLSKTQNTYVNEFRYLNLRAEKVFECFST